MDNETSRSRGTPAAAPEDSTRALEPSIPLPRVIGGYRIIRQLGAGGMGVVYEAEQQHPKRPVALKVIRGGRFVDERAVRLFERETQALARLRHPHIAAIYEAGRTDEGEHFFAMELVRGAPLQDYLASRAHDGAMPPGELQARLLLFCEIAEAVNYAHQRGVIHRDLKPSNILVCERAISAGDSSGATRAPDVKILDFGLARVTDIDVAAATSLTDAGLIEGTLAYMSPEQARGNPDEIDLRSDVYSLGVILFEMVTGRLPYDVEHRAPLEAVRVICEAPAQFDAASTRGRASKLDRDLVTIIRKALEKEPARRYQGALALAEDIQRYLARQPILARPPSTMYQLGKLVARHRAAFGSAVAFAVLVVAFGITMAVQSARIGRERDKALVAEKSANQVSAFLVDLFRTSDPTHVGRASLTAREILDRGAAKITRDLGAQPLVQARLMDTVGRVYDNLGLYEQALPLIETGFETRVRLVGENSAEAASSLGSLGTVWWHKGDLPRAKALLLRALAIRERLYGPDHIDVGASLHNLANLHLSTGEYDEAERLGQRALAIREQHLGTDDPDVASTRNTLGAIAYRKGDLAAARRQWERTLAIRERTLGPENPLLAQTLNNLAVVRNETDDPSGARPLLERVVEIQEKSLGPNHPDLASGLSNLGDVLFVLRDYDGARKRYERAIAIQEAAGPQNPELGRFLAGLAGVRLETGDVDGARALYTRSLDIRERALGRRHPELAGSLAGLANCDRAERRYADSEALFDRALSLCRDADGKYVAGAADFLRDYARLLRATGREAKAVEVEDLARSLRAVH